MYQKQDEKLKDLEMHHKKTKDNITLNQSKEVRSK